MNLSSFIAGRYFRSKRKKNFINLLTIISVVIVAVCTASLVVVLSVFNGLEGLLRSLNSSFDPEIKIEAVKGKSFLYTDSLKSKIERIEGVELITEVIEDYAYVKYKQSEMVVTMKGVSDEFLEEHRIDDAIIIGETELYKDQNPQAIIGQGVRYMLSVAMGDEFTNMQIHYIKDIKIGSLNPSEMYSRKSIRPGAVFSIQKYYDENYVFVPLDFAQDLLSYGNKRTSLEIKTSDNVSINRVQGEIKNQLGADFRVLNNEEQHADLYKILKIEKLFVFIALILILGVGSINILFVLSMLAIDKKADIAIMFSLGIRSSTVRNIFIKEGLYISLTGTLIGMALGIITCLAQQHFGLVGMGMQTAVQNIYPVKMEYTDFLFTGLSIITITLLVSYRPARIAMNYSSLENLPS